MVDARSDLLDLQAVFLEVFDLLWLKVMLLVSVAEGADLLGVHPVEHACLATVSPCVHAAVLGQRH